VKRWLFTALSFAAVIGVSVYAVLSGGPHGVDLAIPLRAHLLAFLAFAVEVGARSIKLTWSARSVNSRLPLVTSLRTSLGGDFGACITPARMGAEPARFLILAEAGIAPSDRIVILYAELFFEMISLAIIVIAISVLFHASNAAFFAMVGVVGGYAMFVLGLGAVGVLLSRRNVREEPGRFARKIRLHGRRWEIVQRWFERMRTTVDAFKHMRLGWAALALLASITHIAVRFTVLPAIVYSSTGASVPLAPLVVWPLGIIYGAGVVPAPGGGGAVELAFRAAFRNVIPAELFAASLVWWRFYTFYLYIVLGALIAGNTALRAVRQAEDMEEELERA
jgi:glycosyltransferase 2 family protein